MTFCADDLSIRFSIMILLSRMTFFIQLSVKS